MSLQFNDPINKKGIIQSIERKLSLNDGDISGNSTLLAYFTAEVNLAIDKLLDVIFKIGGTWNFDDSNQTDYPIIKANIVSGRKDYQFTTDGSGNLILEIYKAFVLPSATATLYQEIYSIDAQSQGDEAANITSENTTQGSPYRYDKTANAIFLDPTPNYNATNGLKLYINREATYFLTTDTTKKPGFAGIYHDYLAMLAAYKYASSKGMPQAGGRLRNGAFTGLLYEIQSMEASIADYYGQRQKDDKPLSTGNNIQFI